MVRRVTPSQYNSMVRQAQAKHREAIRKLNQQIDKVNRENKRAVDDYNRKVRQHNQRVRSNQQKLKSAIQRLNQEARRPARVTYTVESRTVYTSYQQLDARYDSGYYGDHFNEALDLAEREASNSVELEALLGEEPQQSDHQQTFEPDGWLAKALSRVQADLTARWEGALFALNPRNPDAARHFCTSAREVFVQIFDALAPDAMVRLQNPTCDQTPNGTPSRRAKIKYLLATRSLGDQSLENFIDIDIENILSLFRLFNDGTHGKAGAYDFNQLAAIKARVEDGMIFLLKIAE